MNTLWDHAWVEIKGSAIWSTIGAPRTLPEAFHKSLQKWILIARLHKENYADVSGSMAADNCGLCNLFLDDQCMNCPIAQKMGASHCRQTPYEVYHDLASYAVACQELQFLVKLAYAYQVIDGETAQAILAEFTDGMEARTWRIWFTVTKTAYIDLPAPSLNEAAEIAQDAQPEAFTVMEDEEWELDYKSTWNDTSNTKEG